MVNKTTGGSSSKDDQLDSFLTTIESKLRGPFSSLDLAKAVSTAALRPPSTTTQFGSGSSSANATDAIDPARKYLHDLSAVFGRTNKVIQCRMLIGLLGLNDLPITNKKNTDAGSGGDDDSVQYLTPEILRILHETQEESHEDWVRTTSGLIEGVMFRTKDGSVAGNTRESCRGNEAAKTIRDTGTEVCEKVEREIQKVGLPYQDNQPQLSQSPERDQQPAKTTTNTEPKKPSAPTSAAAANKRNRGFVIEKVKASSSPPAAVKKEEKPEIKLKQEESPAVVARTEPAPPDLNACFAPYRYRLIPTPILNTIIPEFKLTNNSNNGSLINNSNCHFQVNTAAKILQVDLELETQRAKEHGSNVTSKPKNQCDSRLKSDPTAATGISSKAILPPGFRQAKKRRPVNLFNTTTKFRPQQTKTVLRRKAGGAQALMKSGAAAASGGAVLNKLGSSVSGRFSGGSVKRDPLSRMGGGAGRSSRMKMIDDDDVDDTLTKLQRSNATSNMTAAELRASKRKRILEKAAQRGIHGSGGGTMSSFGNQQLRKKQRVLASSAARGRPGMQRMPTKTEPHSPKQQHGETPEWESLLRDRSNKMSNEDKLRVEKFFTTTNAAERSALLLPSEKPVKKIKIHEERGKDPATGQEIKETFYLELDYDTGTSKQSKKVKRYEEKKD